MNHAKRLERTLKEADAFLHRFDPKTLDTLPSPALEKLLSSTKRAQNTLTLIKSKIKKGGAK